MDASGFGITVPKLAGVVLHLFLRPSHTGRKEVVLREWSVNSICPSPNDANSGAYSCTPSVPFLSGS